MSDHHGLETKPRKWWLESAALTDRGQRRRRNEDTVFQHTYQGKNNGIGLYMVCDGLGGHGEGEVASKMAAQSMLAELGRVFAVHRSQAAPAQTVPSSLTLQRWMRTAVTKANTKIRRYVQTLDEPPYRTPGSTVTLALIYGHLAHIANVGDSRTYTWREGQLTQITHDHSLAAQLAQAGHIQETEIATHPRNNIISRALGLHENVEADLFQWHLQPGDRLLLCSDGLWKAFPDSAELAAWLGSTSDADELCWQLVAEANQRDGSDNISVIIVNINEQQDQQVQEQVATWSMTAVA